MTNQEKKGRRIVLVYIALVLLVSAGVIAIYAINVSTERAGQQLFRFVLTALLCLFLYQGSNAAKWIAVVLFFVGGGLGLLLSLQDSLLAIALGTGLSALYLSFAILLIASPSVNAFLAYQRADVAREQREVYQRLRQDRGEYGDEEYDRDSAR